ncbi:MAG: phytanoyl-CoA dioxygenase family protein [Pseudomonadota bacterium]|uniref:phytanoyl-CoA dioxygenase family protein n=1 Tax=Gallaecimonas pentaromativorans TaxID=584787 RepID=UPI00067E96CB|nr:phytanoyl-CoA dioxygenase family protein [Gallaecimonas pentaromativorans]MED5523925.1 phytanoyl-CoA dioxygenase family protein [Pseudomonadota bacterium]
MPPNSLHQNGYILLRQAIPRAWLGELQAVFEAGVMPSERWPVPRGRDWRHAQVDLAPEVMALCRLPVLLAAVGELIGERFFLAQVEGREPLAGGGWQQLHRDFSANRPGDTVNAIAFLDDYGPDNGATRIVPGSHRGPWQGGGDETGAVGLSGQGGDILVFDADLVHGAGLNRSGERRRSLLMGYFAEPLYQSHAETAALRGVRMACHERFLPASHPYVAEE